MSRSLSEKVKIIPFRNDQVADLDRNQNWINSVQCKKYFHCSGCDGAFPDACIFYIHYNGVGRSNCVPQINGLPEYGASDFTAHFDSTSNIPSCKRTLYDGRVLDDNDNLIPALSNTEGFQRLPQPLCRLLNESATSKTKIDLDIDWKRASVASLASEHFTGSENIEDVDENVKNFVKTLSEGRSSTSSSSDDLGSADTRPNSSAVSSNSFTEKLSKALTLKSDDKVKDSTSSTSEAELRFPDATKAYYHVIFSSLPVVCKRGDETCMQLQIFHEGPIIAYVKCYLDFMHNYPWDMHATDYIYMNNPEKHIKANYEGMHVITLTGWGNQDLKELGVTKYWRGKNSWGNLWGLGLDDTPAKPVGLFKIERGSNAAGIEDTETLFAYTDPERLPKRNGFCIRVIEEKLDETTKISSCAITNICRETVHFDLFFINTKTEDEKFKANFEDRKGRNGEGRLGLTDEEYNLRTLGTNVTCLTDDFDTFKKNSEGSLSRIKSDATPTVLKLKGGETGKKLHAAFCIIQDEYVPDVGTGGGKEGVGLNDEDASEGGWEEVQSLLERSFQEKGGKSDSSDREKKGLDSDSDDSDTASLSQLKMDLSEHLSTSEQTLRLALAEKREKAILKNLLELGVQYSFILFV